MSPRSWRIFFLLDGDVADVRTLRSRICRASLEDPFTPVSPSWRPGHPAKRQCATVADIGRVLDPTLACRTDPSCRGE